MHSFGWTDDTADTIDGVVRVPATRYPYGTGDAGTSFHVWVGRSFSRGYEVRIEGTMFDGRNARGHRGGTYFEGMATVDVDPYSIAAHLLYGGRLQVGGGPTLDVTHVRAKVGHGDRRWIHTMPGFTFLATLRCFRYREGEVVLRACQHFGGSFDIGPYTDSFTTATYVVRGIGSSYTQVGFGIRLSLPGK